MNYDLTPYKNLYIETAKVYIHNVQEDLMQLQKNHNDKYAISDIYICAHSLKSQSTVMKYSQISIVSKHIERLFHSIKENTLSVNGSLLSVLDEAINDIEQDIQTIETNNSENDLTSVIQKLKVIQ